MAGPLSTLPVAVKPEGSQKDTGRNEVAGSGGAAGERDIQKGDGGEEHCRGKDGGAVYVEETTPSSFQMPDRPGQLLESRRLADTRQEERGNECGNTGARRGQASTRPLCRRARTYMGGGPPFERARAGITRARLLGSVQKVKNFYTWPSTAHTLGGPRCVLY